MDGCARVVCGVPGAGGVSIFHASTPGNKDRFLGTPVKREADDRCAYGAIGAQLLKRIAARG
jgi:hypothetical protein